MKIFWLRLIIFCGLWAVMIFQYSINQAASLIAFTLVLGIYFFVSIRKELFAIYMSLSAIIVLHGILMTSDFTYTVLLLLYLSIFSAYRQKGKYLYSYLFINLTLSLILVCLYSDRIVEMIIVCCFFYFLIVSTNRMALEKNEQHEIYDQVLGEYRKLKRMNLVADKNARLEERTKIARDIHDSVGHRLTALIMKLKVLSIRDEKMDYSELKQMAQDSLDETRQAVKALQGEEHEGLATVVHLIRKLEAESHILVQFTIKQGVLSVQTSNEKSVVLYRAIQEAMTNAMRHAQSREVQVTLGKSATGAILFEITNKIYDARSYEFGFGLKNMQERLNKVCGTLHVYQTEKKFVVMGTIPVE